MKIRELFENNKDEFSSPEDYVKFLYSELRSSGCLSPKQYEQKNCIEVNETGEIQIDVFHPKFDSGALDKNGEIPFQIADFQYDTFSYKEPSYWENGLKSVKNFPKRIDNNCTIATNKLNDYTDGPEYVGGQYTISGNAKEIKNLRVKTKNLRIEYPFLEKLSGMEKSEIDEIFIGQCMNLKGNFLGLLKIKGLKRVSGLTQKFTPTEYALRIINKYLQEEKRDILACQEELMDNGLEDYAQL